jgi:hypothetical protein
MPIPVELVEDEDLYNLLADLGNSPHEIAETLREAGVKGQRKLSERCPIAKWLTTQTNCREVQVDYGAAGVYLTLGPGESFICTPPAAIDEFIRAFDDGEYPDLDAEPPDGQEG